MARTTYRRSSRLLVLLSVATLSSLLLLPLGPVRADEDGDDQDSYSGEPEAAAELFDEGDVLREEGKWDEAATKYWEAVEADLRHYRAHVRYQEAALAAGDPKDEMIVDYKSFIEDYPKVFDLKLHLLRLTASPKERIAALDALRKKHGNKPNVGVELGRAYIAAGNAAAAIEPLTAALALCPAARKDVPLLLADAEYRAGKVKEAHARLDALVKGDPEFFDAQLALARIDLATGQDKAAAARADLVIRLRPTLIAAFLLKAEALSRREERTECLNTLVAARRLAPENNDVRLAYADALSHAEEGYDPALALYGDVLESDGESAHALFGSAWVLERQEKYEEAEEKYRELVGIAPDDVVAINSVGYCLFKQGRVSDAQIQFKKASDLDPDYASAALNLGATFDAQAKYNDAIKVYEDFIKDHPNNLRALVNCAFDYESLGSFPKALKYLMEAHGIQPNDAMIIIWIGDNHYFEKRWKDAEKWYKDAVELDAESFFAWRGLGYTLVNMKRWEDAAAALEKANKIDEKDLDVYLALGDIYMNEIEDLDKALHAYQEYVQRGGNDPAVQDAITAIRKQLKK